MTGPTLQFLAATKCRKNIDNMRQTALPQSQPLPKKLGKAAFRKSWPTTYQYSTLATTSEDVDECLIRNHIQLLLVLTLHNHPVHSRLHSDWMSTSVRAILVCVVPLMPDTRECHDTRQCMGRKYDLHTLHTARTRSR